jgi:hypothetical protein
LRLQAAQEKAEKEDERAREEYIEAKRKVRLMV